MRKIFLTLLLLGSAVSASAQGTVFFSGGGFMKISSGFYGSAASTWTVLPATANLINFGLFYGFGATQPANLTFLGVEGVNSTSLAGVIVNTSGSVISALQIPGTTPGETDVWIQIAGWSASFGTDWAAAKVAAMTTYGDYFGQTTIINVAQPLGVLGRPRALVLSSGKSPREQTQTSSPVLPLFY